VQVARQGRPLPAAHGDVDQRPQRGDRVRHRHLGRDHPGGDKATVSERQSTAWSGGWIFTKLKGARADDRVWVQGAYYGPTEPWSDGVRVGRLTRCDIR